MAENKDNKAEATPPVEPAKASKRALLVGAGAAIVLALAFCAALLAIPSKEHAVPHLEGPFVVKLSNSDIQVNLAGEGSKRYLVMSLQAEYSTYDEAYVTGRMGGGGHGGGEDPHYAALLKDALLAVSATKTRDQVTDPVLVDAFLAEVREAVDPVLFPVYVGDAQSARARDSHSGLRMGESAMESTMRGLLYEHSLHVDAPRRTVRLDAGPSLEFEENERDLRVVDAEGRCVFLDASGLEHDFVGEVPIGVAGKVRRIYRDSFLVQ